MTFGLWPAKQVAEATSYWWLLLISGGFWILLALAILQFNLTSVWSIAILTGVVLLMASMTEFAMLTIAQGSRWAHGLLAVLFLIAGIIAFAWPGETFVVLSRLIGWYLLFIGVFEVVESLAYRHSDLWWLRLILGAVTIGIAFWAVGSIDRSAVLLVLWVGLGALFRGIDHIFLAFEYRHLHEQAKSVVEPPGQFGAPGQPAGTDESRVTSVPPPPPRPVPQ